MRTVVSICLLAFALATPACAGNPFSELLKGVASPATGLSESDIAAGLREALARGAAGAVRELGKPDGYWAASRFRIPLPESIRKAEKMLRKLGAGKKVDQFHQGLNRAAEQAVPVAAEVFADAARQLTLRDARNILQGPDNAATSYFQRTTSDALAAKFRPIVTEATAKVGVTQAYKRMVKEAGPLGARLGLEEDLDGYVTQRALESLFLRVAEEEARIRRDPAARTTEILKRVFGG